MSVFLLSALLFGIRPQLAGVTLRPGLHSYQQLASELTEQGIVAQCEPSIRRRYALIRVPPTPWETLKPVLEAALDIRFAQGSDGRFTIQRDPKTAGIEDVLLTRFARRYSATIQSAIRDGYDYFRQMEAATLRGDAEDPVFGALETMKSLPVGSSDRTAMTVAIELKDRISQRFIFAQLWDGLDLIHLLRGSRETVTTSEDFDSESPPDNPIGELLLPPIQSFGISNSDGEMELPSKLIERWRVDARSFALSKDIAIVSDTGWPDETKSRPEIVPTLITFDSSWDELYRGLPGETEHNARVKITGDWLSTDAANLPLTGLDAIDTVSEFFTTWSQETHKPIVMEVAAARERLYDPFSTAEPKPSVSALLRSRVAEIMNLKLMRTPWTIGEMNGITVVRNELRFIDHVIPFNPAALISLESAKDKSADRINKVKDLIDAAIVAEPEDQAAALEYGTFGRMSGFPEASPYLRLISTDVKCLDELSSLQSGQVLRLPVASFSESARRKFAESLRRVSTMSRHLWSPALLPDFETVLSTSAIEVVAQKENEEYVLRFSLTATTDKETNSVLPPVSVGPVHLSD